MAIDPRTVFENYIPAFSIQNVMLDKMSGAPLAGGSVGFYKDLQRLDFKAVYQITGTAPNYTFTQLPNPVPVSLSGDFIDAFGDPVIPYFYPYDDDFNVELYYIKALNSGGQLQFEREAQPYFQAVVIPSDTFANTENLLSNPQFVQTYFNNEEPLTLTLVAAVNQVLPIAPDWDLVASGSGTITLQRVALTSTTTPTNPPFVLDINSSGISALTLRQRLTQSPRIMSGGFISAIFIAASQDSSTHQLTWSYTPSNGTLDNEIMIQETITNDGDYNVLTGQLEITGILNPDPATTGYVDIDLAIPVGAHIRVSSFQIVGTTLPQDIPYDQQVTAEQINRLYHDFQPSYQQSKNSLTPWWYFPQNPRQFGAPDNSSVASLCSYLFDQTILYQTAANQVGYILGPGEGNLVLAIKANASAADARFALISYIAPQSVAGSWGYFLSCLARLQLDTPNGNTVHAKMRILWRETLPPNISPTEPISSWTLGQDPSFSAGWNVLTPLNDPSYSISQSSEDANAGPEAYVGYPYNQFKLPFLSGSTDMIAVVFYIMEPLDSTPGSEDSVGIRSISTVQNQFAQDWVPTSKVEVRNACNYYFYSSYAPGTALGTATFINQLIYGSNTTVTADILPGDFSVVCVGQSFTITYPLQNRQPNGLEFYSPDTGAIGDMDVFIKLHASTVLTATSFSGVFTEAEAPCQTYATYYPTSDVGAHLFTGTTDGYGSSYWAFHFYVDSRLGV